MVFELRDMETQMLYQNVEFKGREYQAIVNSDGKVSEVHVYTDRRYVRDNGVLGCRITKKLNITGPTARDVAAVVAANPNKTKSI